MLRFAPPFRLTLLAAALGTSPGAHAQEVKNPPAPATETKLQTVEIKGSADSYDARRDDTATKIVVNHEEIVKYGDTSVLDVLKRLPGITVSGAAGRNGGEIRMRGLGSGYTQILINGERAPAGFSMDSLAPESIEKIEILRAASAEYSTQSVAGTINIVLKKAVSKAQRELKVHLGGAGQSRNTGASLQLSDRADKLSWSLSGSLFYSDPVSDSSTVLEDADPDSLLATRHVSKTHEKGHFMVMNLGPRVNWTFENGDLLTWQGFLNLLRYGKRVGIETVAPIGGPSPFADQQEHLINNYDSFRNDITLAKKLESGARLDLKIGASFGEVHNNWDRLGHDAQGGLVLDTGTYYHETDQGFSSTGKYATALVEGHSLAFGWDTGLNLRQDDQNRRDSPLKDAEPTVLTPDHYASRVSRLALFSQDEWNITPRWSLYLGARWEGVKTRTSGTGFADSASSSSVFSPLMHTLYKLPDSKGDQLRLALTRTYKAPSTYVLMPRRFVTDDNSKSNPDSLGNPGLKPELATGIDASFEHYWGENALLSASVSARRIEDYTGSTVLQGPDGRWFSMQTNKGAATTRSLELEAKFPLKSLFGNAPAVDVKASVNRNWSRVDRIPGPNNRLDQQTPLSGNLGVDYTSGDLSMGGSFSFRRGGQARVSEHQINYQSVRRDLEAFALWKFDAKNKLRVGLYNLLRQDYISESTYADDTGVERRRQLYPPFVSVRVTLEMKF
jgi:outer membrane receptor for ferrienterochelin and colicins